MSWSQRMADKLGLHAAFAIERLLEGEDHQHPVDVLPDQLDAVLLPGPQLRADEVEDRNAQPVQLFGQPEVNLGKIDEYGYVGRRARMDRLSLRNSRQMRGRWRTTSVRPMTAISSERTMHSRPAVAMRSPPMPKKSATGRIRQAAF